MVTHATGAGLEWVWAATWQAGVIGVVVWAVTTGLRGWLTPVCRRALWALVLVRLALPVLPESRWSAWGMMEGREAAPAVSDVVGGALPRARVNGWTIVRGPMEGFERPAVAPGLRNEPWPLLRLLLLLVWSGGVFIFLCAIALSNIRLARRLRGAAPIQGEEMISLLEECKRGMEVRREVGMVEFDTHGPGLAGMLWPRILLPAGLDRRLTREQLRFVILHELAHLKRHDILVDWLVAIVHVVHWFNPVAWLAVGRLRAERELSRDAMVLRATSADARVEYGRAILRIVEDVGAARPRFGAVGLLEERGQLRARIAAIAEGGRASWVAVPLTVVLVAVVGCSGMTKRPKDAALPRATKVAKASFDPVRLEAPATMPVIEREYSPEVRTMLDRRLPEIRFDGVAFGDVIDFLRDVTGASIFVNWRALEAAGVGRTTPVSARMRDIRFAKALDTLLAQAGRGEVALDYSVDEGVVTISTAEELNRNVAIHVYDIRDLLSIVPENDAPFGFEEGDAEKGDKRSKEERTEEMVKRVTDLIMETVDKKSWVEFGGRIGSMRFLSGQLIITQTPENQRAIVGLLEKLREGHGIQIVMEARFATMPRDDLKKMSLEHDFLFGLDAKGAAPAGSFLDEGKVNEVVRAMEGSRGTAVLAAPRLIAFNAQRASIVVGQEQAYTAGYGARKEDGTREPVIGTATSGITLLLQGIVSADRKYVTVALHPKVSELLAMKEVRWEQGEAGERLMVQRPEMRVNEVNATVGIPNAQTLALVVPRTEGKGKEDEVVLFLLKATVVERKGEDVRFPLIDVKNVPK